MPRSKLHIIEVVLIYMINSLEKCFPVGWNINVG